MADKPEAPTKAAKSVWVKIVYPAYVNNFNDADNDVALTREFSEVAAKDFDGVVASAAKHGISLSVVEVGAEE